MPRLLPFLPAALFLTEIAPVLGVDLPAFSERLAFWPAGGARDAALSVLAGKWAQLETPAAIAWADSLTEDSLRAAASAEIAKTWTGADPAAAAGIRALPGLSAADRTSLLKSLPAKP